jgi:hypothetical protein
MIERGMALLIAAAVLVVLLVTVGSNPQPNYSADLPPPSGYFRVPDICKGC